MAGEVADEPIPTSFRMILDAKMASSNNMKLGGAWILLLLALASSLVQVSQCNHTGTARKHREGYSRQGLDLVGPISALSMNIMSAPSSKHKNLVISGLSIHGALGTVLLGANKQSQAAEDLINILELRGSSYAVSKEMHASYQTLYESLKDLSVASPSDPELPSYRFWTEIVASKDVDLSESYVADLKKYYGGIYRKVHNKESAHQVADEINGWAAQGHIQQEVLSKNWLTDDRRALTYLTGAYVRDEFQTYLSQETHKFFHQDGHNTRVQTRVNTCRYCTSKLVEYIRDSDSKRRIDKHNARRHAALDRHNFRVIEKELKHEIKLVFIMPIDLGREHLQDLEQTLHSNQGEHMESILADLDDKDEKIFKKLSFPSVKFENTVKLVPVLKEIGLSRIFDHTTDLSKMSDRDLRVLAFRHASRFELSNRGIQVTSVGGVTSGTSGSYHDYPEVEISHPFIFVVRYRKVPLYYGHVYSVNKPEDK